MADIKTKQQILESAQPIWKSVTGVYLLIKDGKVVYVGQTGDIIARVSFHITEGVKQFDSFSYVECLQTELNNVEAHYIYEFCPTYNIQTPSSNMYKTARGLKELFGLSAIIIKRWIKHFMIEDKRDLYRVSDFDELYNFKSWLDTHYPMKDHKQCSVSYLKEYLEKINA